MYTTYFGFREAPFNVTPDPRFFYTNPIYQEATASLHWGITARKGFVVLTGDTGTGKTTLLRRLMANLAAKVRFACISDPTLSLDDLLSSVWGDFGLTVHGLSRPEKLAELNTFLLSELKQGGTAALLIDEAQHLADDVLENLRLLSNLETSTQKLLQIVLVGQPELELKLNRPQLRAVKHRIAVQCRLSRLRDREIGSYVAYRLAAAGYRGQRLFSPDAVREIAALSKGVPRLVNIICDNALLIAFASSQREVSADVIREVARDLGLESPESGSAMLDGESVATPVPGRAWAIGLPRWPGTRFVVRRLFGPLLATLALLALVGTGAVGSPPGAFVLAGVRQGLDSFLSEVAALKDSLKAPEPPSRANPDHEPERSAAAEAETVANREPVEPAPNREASSPATRTSPGPAEPAPVSARPDGGVSVGTPPSLPPRPWSATGALVPPPEPRRETPAALAEAPRRLYVTHGSQAAPEPAPVNSSPGPAVGTVVEPPRMPPPPPNPLGPRAQAPQGPTPSPTPRSPEASGRADAPPGSTTPALKATEPPQSPKPQTASTPAGPSRPARPDAVDSSEIIDWFLKEYQGNK